MSDRFASVRFRILFLAVVAIAIPGIILAGFGLKLTSEHREGTEALVGRFYQTTSDSVMGSVLDKVDEQEKQLLAWLAERPMGNWSGQLDAISQNTPIVEQFFVLSPSLDVLFPPTRKTHFPEPVKWRSGPGGQGAETLLKSGNQLEFVQKDLDAAAKKYRTCADGPFTAAFRVEALVSLGACLKRLDKSNEAVEAYRRVSTEFEPRDVPLSHRLLAAYEIGRLHDDAGRLQDAADAYLALYGELLGKPASPEGADTLEFFLATTRERLKELAQDESAGARIKDEMKAAAIIEKRRESRREFRQELKRWVTQRIEWEIADASTAQGEFAHAYKLIDGEPFLVAFTRAGGGVAASNIFGFKVDLKYVKNKLLLPEVIDTKVGRGTVITFIDRENHPVLPVQMTKTEPSSFSLTQEFPRIFEFWRLGVLDQENEHLLVVSRNQNLLITSLLALMVTVMIGGLYLTLRDINRQLELSRLKSDFVSNVSHELKTPLTLIRMFGETLSLGRVKNEEKAQEYYEIITRESERLTKLIDNVLDFSRIESGSKEYNFRQEDVGDIVQLTFESYREGIERDGFECTLSIEDGDFAAKVDRDAIEQALLNLLTNARKYSPQTKEIRVSVSTDGEEIRIEVADRGLGISSEDQRRIFDKFFRVADDRVRSVRGSGLGLAITNHTIEAHGGRIEIESELGVGSSFTLVLPAYDPELDSKYQMNTNRTVEHTPESDAEIAEISDASNG